MLQQKVKMLPDEQFFPAVLWLVSPYNWKFIVSNQAPLFLTQESLLSSPLLIQRHTCWEEVQSQQERWTTWIIKIEVEFPFATEKKWFAQNQNETGQSEMLQKDGCCVWWHFPLQEDCSWQGYRGIWFRMATCHSIILKHSDVDNTREMCLVM